VPYLRAARGPRSLGVLLRSLASARWRHRPQSRLTMPLLMTASRTSRYCALAVMAALIGCASNTPSAQDVSPAPAPSVPTTDTLTIQTSTGPVEGLLVLP